MIWWFWLSLRMGMKVSKSLVTMIRSTKQAWAWPERLCMHFSVSRSSRHIVIWRDPFQTYPESVVFCVEMKCSYWSSILKIVTSDYIGLVLYYLVICLSKLQFAKRYFHPSEESLKLPLSLLAYVNTILKYVRIYSSAELEPVYWHMVTRKLYTQALAAGTTSTHAHRS